MATTKKESKISLRKKAAAVKAAIEQQDHEQAAREAAELEEGIVRLHAELEEEQRIEDARLKEVADEHTRKELAEKSPWRKFLDWF